MTCPTSRHRASSGPALPRKRPSRPPRLSIRRQSPQRQIASGGSNDRNADGNYHRRHAGIRGRHCPCEIGYGCAAGRRDPAAGNDANHARCVVSVILRFSARAYVRLHVFDYVVGRIDVGAIWAEDIEHWGNQSPSSDRHRHHLAWPPQPLHSRRPDRQA